MATNVEATLPDSDWLGPGKFASDGGENYGPASLYDTKTGRHKRLLPGLLRKDTVAGGEFRGEFRWRGPLAVGLEAESQLFLARFQKRRAIERRSVMAVIEADAAAG